MAGLAAVASITWSFFWSFVQHVRVFYAEFSSIATGGGWIFIQLSAEMKHVTCAGELSQNEHRLQCKTLFLFAVTEVCIKTSS